MSKEEIWLPVPSKPGIMASSWGRIQLPARTAKMPNGGMRSYSPKPTYGFITRSNPTAKHCYMGLANRIYGNLKIHQLVCEAFHGSRPEHLTDVMHADENGLNNVPENLSWGSRKQNLNASGFVKYCKTRTGVDSPVVKGRLPK